MFMIMCANTNIIQYAHSIQTYAKEILITFVKSCGHCFPNKIVILNIIYNTIILVKLLLIMFCYYVKDMKIYFHYELI